MFNTQRSVDPTGLAQLFNLPPAITEQANDELVTMIKNDTPVRGVSAASMFISPEDVTAILSENEGA